jgi:hypothetical protein
MAASGSSGLPRRLRRWAVVCSLVAIAFALLATVPIARADARPIFRLAGGGWQESPLAPLRDSAGSGAVAPMPGGAGFVVIGCRTVTRVGRDAIPKRAPIQWAVRRPACSDGYLDRPVATPVGNEGDLLVAGLWYFGRVVRVSPDGRAHVVTRLFSEIGGIAALRGGGFLISEPGNRRVRRVSARGGVTTVAGSGRAGARGDGGPAVGASLRRPMGLAVEADGSFLVADDADHRVRRVRRDGTIETVAGNGVRAPAVDGRRATKTSLVKPRRVAALPDGAFLIADPRRVYRVGSAGRITTVAGDGGIEWGRSRDAGGEPWPEGNFFDGIGGPATRASIGPVSSIAVADDGSYLVRSGTSDTKLYVLPARRSRYFGVAFRKLRPQLGYIAYRVNRPARVTLRLRPFTGPTFTVTHRARPGLNRLRIPAGIRPRAYYLQLTAITADGYRSADEVGVVMGRRLPNRVARIAINTTFDRVDYENLSEVLWCHRMSLTRVDCATGEADIFDCEYKRAVRLHAGGQLEAVGYPCGRWRRKVPWHNSSRLPLFAALY